MQYTQTMVLEYAEEHSSLLKEKQYNLLSDINLHTLINQNNPYLFPLNIQTAEAIIKEIVNAYISSSEETMFGDWLEGLAIFINQKVYAGRKSGIKGIDLEFDKEDKRYLVSIKSGPNWGNSSQVEKMVTLFNTAKKTLRTSNAHLNIICINGCCYGKDHKPDKGSYYKYCGQAFWAFIGGNETIYTDIIEPLGHKAKERNDDYMTKYARMINRFTKEFIELFCDNSGAIEWDTLVRFNSGKNV